ncbi:phasin family protein [Sphingomonas oryzagri]
MNTAASSALLEASRRAVRGIVTMGQDRQVFFTQQYERARESLEQLALVRSPTDLLKLQSDYAQAAVGTAFAEGSKIAEDWLKVASEIAEPIMTCFTNTTAPAGKAGASD